MDMNEWLSMSGMARLIGTPLNRVHYHRQYWRGLVTPIVQGKREFYSRADCERVREYFFKKGE